MYLSHNPRLNNIYNNGSISYINSSELEEVSEYDINKFPKDSKIHLFVDGFGSDEILSIVARCPSVLFRIKNEIVVSCGLKNICNCT